MRLTHTDKELYQEDHLTKQDIFNYYKEINKYILPYIVNRPLTLLRCPSGYKDCFYQRKLHDISTPGLYASNEYIYIKDEEGLLSLVQLGVLEIHPWGSRIEKIETPDMIIFDLDPGPEILWKKVVKAAFELRALLKALKLKSFVKTTGGKGLHVVVPFKPECSWDEVKSFTYRLVEVLQTSDPVSYILEMSKAKRKGKIFVDYLRNQRGATAIAPYSSRARIHAPVATPIEWDELTSDFKDTYYTVGTLPKRLSQLKKDPWRNFWKTPQRLPIKKV